MTGRFTVYLVNRRPGLKPGSTLRDLADQYVETIDGEFAAPVPIVGVSTGGSIAQLFAANHPDLVRRLVLLASACRLSEYGRQLQRTSPGSPWPVNHDAPGPRPAPRWPPPPPAADSSRH